MNKFLFLVAVLFFSGCFAIVDDNDIKGALLVKEDEVLTTLKLAEEKSADEIREIIVFETVDRQ